MTSFALTGAAGLPTDIGFIVARAEIDFKLQIEMEPIDICIRITEMRTTSFDTVYEIRKRSGNVAATDGLAKLIGEKEFSILFHEGERDNIHISLVAQRVILVVIFDDRSSLGLVRLRVKKASQELERTFEVLLKKSEAERGGLGRFDSPFAEITDEDIDSLFSE